MENLVLKISSVQVNRSPRGTVNRRGRCKRSIEMVDYTA